MEWDFEFYGRGFRDIFSLSGFQGVGSCYRRHVEDVGQVAGNKSASVATLDVVRLHFACSFRVRLRRFLTTRFIKIAAKGC